MVLQRVRSFEVFTAIRTNVSSPFQMYFRVASDVLSSFRLLSTAQASPAIPTMVSDHLVNVTLHGFEKKTQN